MSKSPSSLSIDKPIKLSSPYRQNDRKMIQKHGNGMSNLDSISKESNFDIVNDAVSKKQSQHNITIQMKNDKEIKGLKK